MSRLLLSIGLVGLSLSALATTDDSASSDVADSLSRGDAIGAFYVTKVAGAEDDGVEPGDSLCYRCRYGSSPMVMVFARQTEGNFTDLVRTLDSAVAQHEQARLRGLVTLMGDDAAELKSLGRQIAEQAEVKQVPVVIAEDIKTGPPNYHLPMDADVAIVVAKDSQVVNTYSYRGGEIDLAAIERDIEQLVN